MRLSGLAVAVLASLLLLTVRPTSADEHSHKVGILSKLPSKLLSIKGDSMLWPLSMHQHRSARRSPVICLVRHVLDVEDTCDLRRTHNYCHMQPRWMLD